MSSYHPCFKLTTYREALEDLTGGVTTELLVSDILDESDFWNKELKKVNEEFLFGCATGVLDRGFFHRQGIVEGHAYTIMEAKERKSGERLLKLRQENFVCLSNVPHY